MENKKNKVMLSVMAIATLLVAVVGATYAYFTVTVNSTGNNSTNASAARLANLNVDVGGLRKVDKGIYPGWVGYQKITITAAEDTPNGAAVKYSLAMKASNEFDTYEYSEAMSADDNISYSFDNLVVQYSNENNKSTIEKLESWIPPVNLTYTVYSCTGDKVCMSLEEDDIYTQGDLMALENLV